MSNSGKVWDIREAYKQQRNNAWETPGNRGMCMGGQTTPAASESNVVEFVDIISTGNTADFGDLTQARKKGAAAGGFTRILCLGGQTPTNVSTIDFVNPIATGNFSDFGDLVNTGQTTNIAHCNNIKTISADGNSDADGVVITHMASQGNSSPFQNRTGINTTWAVGTGDSTRFLMAGRYPASNQIDSMEIATQGSKIDFGNLTRSGWGMGAVSDSTRSVFFGGYNPSATNIIEFVTTQSAGNSTDFGDLTSTDFIDASGSSNSKRGITFGYQSNKIDVFNIATTGNSTDFGDTLTSTFYQRAAADNGGGGLPQQGFFPQRPSVTYMPGSGRALFNGGQTAPADALVSTVEMFHISTAGNAVDFGELKTTVSNGPGNGASNTRSVIYSGYSPSSPYYDNTIQVTEFASFGNYSDFGDPTQERYANSYGNIGSPTRAIFMGGYAPGSPYYVNIIDYITIATIGNATDFGDLAAATNNVAGCGSSTRGIGMGGYTGSQDDTIQYVTIASTGDATDFGNLTAAKNSGAGVSSSTRGVLGGGNTGSATNVIEYVTIASTGDGTDFGDLTQARNSIASASNSDRGLFMGGSTPSKVNTVDFITIASTGNATDFGDLTVATREASGTSDSHGGLQA